MRPILLVLAAACIAVAPAHASYQIETVDSSLPNSGLNSSLAIDGLGAPHIVYLNTDPNQIGQYGVLRYATRSGASWTFEQIEAGPADLSNGIPDLVLDAGGRPRVVYAQSIVIGVGTVLKYATRESGSWVKETIASGAYVYSRAFIDVDASGRPYVLYLESTGYTSTLYLATRNGPGSWSREAVSTEVTAMPAGLKLDPAGSPMALYRTGTQPALKLATRQAGVWSTQTVDASPNLVPADVHFVLDPLGNPVIGYRDYNSGAGKLATRVGATWSLAATPVDVGFGGAMGGVALAGDGTVVIGFTTMGTSYPYPTKLHVARRIAGIWSVDTVEGTQAPIGSPSVALDGQGLARLSYWYSTQPFYSGVLRFARYSPGSAGSAHRVPQDYGTIQAAIDASADEDTVLVSPGLYDENLNFRGKAIVVRSASGADATIVDGGGRDAVVTFNTGEDARSVLEGFTLRNGHGGFDGGGVKIASADPIVRKNVITGNTGSQGAGVSVNFGSPIIEENVIRDNHANSWGGGVSIGGFSSVILRRNRIEHNLADYDGGGVFLFAAGTPEIRGNVIVDNQAYTQGGGILSYNQSDALVIDNVISRNHVASEGGGIYWLTPSGTRGPYVINNTLVDNTAQRGTGMFTDGYDAGALITNNIFAGDGGDGLLYSGNFNDFHNPAIRYNDVLASSGSGYGGQLGDLTGSSGNIASNPAFLDRAGGNYRLRAGSPAIDHGENGVPGLGAVDADGLPRVVDGDDNGVAVIDLGAFEFSRTASPVVADAGPDQTKECAPSPDGGTAVALDGSSSIGQDLHYHWSATGARFGDASAAITTGYFPVGVTTVVLEVTDGRQTDVDTVLVTVVDTTPPALDVGLDPALLWPPTGRLVPIHATVTASDACGGNVSVSLVSIESTEPWDGDVDGASIGAPDFDFALRAERGGDGPGRFYRVTYEARDESGNAARATALAFVPHDQSGRALLAASANPPTLTIFASNGFDVRTVVPQSVQVADPEHVRFRASPVVLTYADRDGDGLEDLEISLGAVPESAPPSPFGLFARWVARAQDYAAVLTPPVAVSPPQPGLTFTALVLPSPARSTAVLRMNLPTAGPVAIALYDVRGREVMRSAAELRDAGWHDVRLGDVSRFGAGLFFYRVEWKGRVTTGRLVVAP